MTKMTGSSKLRLHEVALEQVRIVALSLRREALLVAVVIAAGTLIIGGEIVSGGPGFDSNETFPTDFVALLLPFAVWRLERRFGPDFLWTLPVDRRQMALARVFAGWVWVMAATAVFAVWLLAMALAAQAPPARIVARVPFAATTTMYLFGSALVLGLRHPARWLAGAVGVASLLFHVSPIDLFPAAGDMVGDVVANWLSLPQVMRPALPFLAFLASLATLLAAASRHGERRRP